MSKLVWGITRIVPFVQEQHAQDTDHLMTSEFLAAYRVLRSECPKGDLRIHLSVEGTEEEVGAKLPSAPGV